MLLKFVEKLFLHIRSQKEYKEKVALRKSFIACTDNCYFGTIGKILSPQYISIGDNCSFGDGIYLTAWDSYMTLIEGEKSAKLNSPD